ncbi:MULTISPECIES: response regulator [unclassified Oceanispirochaeta]|uniref:response regulator transcription factor n=1 Tax=unclassified Oceanispirochaeta TaxID=2635722 RepID=UPI000E08D94A|nr:MULTISPECIES: response regulator [unclassified Oceanispirochaeta]MBF9016563.1 response regulator [Oceanispirochaeta sp. M2]NPD73026.1 response regulator [Oceanispirochaeta sp. M1]RDG31374.1 response regulator [Oceanispirochaeta sp. M1]
MNRVIIVDDDPLVCQGLSVIIPWKEYGFEISHTFKDGFSALDYLKENPVELVITDIKMPGMNGVELIEKIRRESIPSQILILSGYDDYEYLKKAITLNVVSYLMKPVNVQELKANIETVNTRIKNDISNQIFIEGMEALKNTLFQRILGHQITENELRNKLDFLQIQNLMNWESYFIGLLASDEIIKNRIEKIEQNPLLYHFFDIEQKLVLVAETKESLVNLIPENRANNELLFIGEPVKQIFSLVESYQSAWEALIKEKKPDIDKEIEDYIMQMDIAGLREYLCALISKEKNLQYSKESIFSAILIIQNEMHKSQAGDLFSLEDLGISYHFFSIATSQTLLLDKVNSLCDQIELLWISNNKLTGNNIIDSIIRYVHLHLDEGISLSIISDSMNMNPSYLGTLFFQTTGSKFTSYVKEMRIEKACKLLTDTTYKISEIAPLCGFNDIHYFLKVFSSLKSCSPKEYQNLNKT